MGTSHELGQNFARAFGTTYSSDSGEQVHVWQTSWGASTRLIGALIMAHGDDSGLRLPPRLAPTQVVVLLVKDSDGARTAAGTLVEELRRAGHRVTLDDRVDISFGRRAVDWELRGVPLRLEVGPRDLALGNVTLVRRDNGSKVPVPIGRAMAEVGAALDAAQAALLAEATQFRDTHTVRVATVDEAVAAAASGFASLPWAAVGPEGEGRLAEAAVTVRCLQRPDGSLAMSEDEPDVLAVVARAY
jgi:prolyl-tRNA synthetase